MRPSEVLHAAVWTTLYLTVTTRTPPQATQSAPAAPPPLAVAVFQAAPQVPLQQMARTHPGPPGACFRCGMFGHWSRDCATAAPMQQQLRTEMLQEPTAQWPQAMNIPQAHTAPASVASAPPRTGGFTQVGAHTIYTAHTTGRQCDASGPPPYPCSICQGNHWSWQPCLARRANIPPQPQFPQQSQPQPQPQPSSSTDAPAGPKDDADDIGANNGTATQLRYLAMSLDELTAGDVATEPCALAVRAWAEGTRRNWRRDLQRVGKTALMYGDHDTHSALAKHLTLLAAQGRQSATLRGVVSSVRMCDTLAIVGKVVTPLHWALCTVADRAYAHPPPKRIWANVHTLRTLDARTSGPHGTAIVALACLGSAMCWRVNEAASVRPADLATPWRMAFYDQKTQRRWVTARLSHWGEAWRKRPYAIVQHRLAWMPLFASTTELQHALRVALMGTVWHAAAWHAFRRLGAAALAATGAAMAVTARLGRWRSERQAAEYATPPLDWEWEFPALLPWPAPDGGTIMRTTTNMEIWPMAVMGGEASARAKQTTPIPIVVSDSNDDSDDGILGPDVQTDGARPRQRHCQRP